MRIALFFFDGNAHKTDLGRQGELKVFPNAALHLSGEGEHVAGRGGAPVDDDIGVTLEHGRVPDRQPLGTHLVQKPSGCPPKI